MARYWQSRPQEFVSQFVPENLELQQNYYDNLQKNQDVYRKQIEGLGVDFQHLPNDVTGAGNLNNKIQSKLNNLRGYDINDPNQKSKLFSEMQDVRKDISSFGEAGIYDKKAKDYQAEKTLIDKDREKNPLKASYRMAQLEQNAYDKTKAIAKDPVTGQYINTKVEVPKDFDYVQVGDWAMKKANEVTPEQVVQSWGLNAVKNREAIDSYYNGTDEYRIGDSIHNTIMHSANADANVIESIKAESHQFGGKPEERLQSAIDAAVQAKSAHKKTGEIHYRTDSDKLRRNGIKDEKEGLTPTGAVTEGSIKNLLGEDALSLQKQGVFTNDGKIDWNQLQNKQEVYISPATGKPVTAFGKPVGENTKVVTDKDGNSYIDNDSIRLQLNKTINKMATALGYDINKITGNDYEKIYNEFNQFSKTKGFGVQLASATRDYINSTIEKDGLANYTVEVNDNGVYQTDDKLDSTSKNLINNPENKITITNRQSNKEGKNVLEGTVRNRKTNEVLGTVNLRPKNLSENNWFDNVNKVEKQSIDYMTTGDLSKIGTTKKESNDVAKSTLEELNKVKPELSMQILHDLKLENEKDLVQLPAIHLPNGKSIMSFSNSKIPGNIVYLNANDGTYYTNLGDFKKDMDHEWYGTSEGQGTSGVDSKNTQGYKKEIFAEPTEVEGE